MKIKVCLSHGWRHQQRCNKKYPLFVGACVIFWNMWRCKKPKKRWLPICHVAFAYLINKAFQNKEGGGLPAMNLLLICISLPFFFCPQEPHNAVSWLNNNNDYLPFQQALHPVFQLHNQHRNKGQIMAKKLWIFRLSNFQAPSVQRLQLRTSWNCKTILPCESYSICFLFRNHRFTQTAWKHE